MIVSLKSSSSKREKGISECLLSRLDIDECLQKNGGCSHVCVNLKGSMKCTCPSGYELKNDAKTCEDIDECLYDPCQGSCENTDGSYVCSCPSGYLNQNNTCIGNY